MKRIQLPRHREGLVNGAIFTVHCDCMKWATQYAGALKETLEEIDYLYSEEAESRGEFVIAKSGADLESAWTNGRFAALMGLEGGKAIEGSLETLRCLQKLGVRSFGITHNIRNQLADGAGVPQNYGLTDLGKRVVEEVGRLRMVLDLVHLSERGFYDALEASSGTPIISHTGCRELNPFDHGKVPWRNVTDKQIEKLGDRGGVMGIAFLKAFVTGKDESTVEDVIRHLEHAIKLIGIDHVGIGPDYVDYGLPENQTPAWREKSTRNRARYKGSREHYKDPVLHCCSNQAWLFRNGDLKDSWRKFPQFVQENTGIENAALHRDRWN